ncbi:N-fatty-acyl-amino acid synthase/hydrolase PM20D1.2 [Aplysia californica]|uniref:N-fatty-acyl-amino acid synthase/hydrolase PM20D1.2 n=1 Tax=Aplysia californica TaxID=6500 RepID=A0ABM0ZVU0_APLCA|nr:N-fatty-acyl-amino acid synthase/hydrolase PM20D1.2 [Aplysia californica]
MIKRVILAALLLFMIILVVRTVYLSRRSVPAKECKASDTDFIPLSQPRLQRFQQALRFRSISEERGVFNADQLQKLGDFLIASFPLVHAQSEWERVNNYSFLYHIKGSNPSLKPYLLMSHLDVVPVTNLDKWDAPPFSGDVHDNFIYGRGAIDVKQCVMGILEATEYVLASGVRPVRSFYIAFGHDEEIHGHEGANRLAQRLREKGVTELEFVSDEGLPVSEGIIAGITGPVASVGVSEKGFVMLKLSVDAPPGHSSMPPRESTIGILARAVHKLESNPHPSVLGQGIETDMFQALVPQMSIPHRVILSNIWIFEPVLSWFLSLNPTTAAMIRTVTSVTIFKAGVKNNVIPPHAEAIVNHRIHPSQTVKEVIEYDRALIADDRVKIEVDSMMEAHPAAGYGEEDFGYQVLKTTVGQIWPKAIVVPGIMIGNTDTKYYLPFTHNVYRFSPTHMFPGDPERFHGINERISVKNYEQVINFYYHLIRNSDQAGVSPTHPPHHEF